MNEEEKKAINYYKYTIDLAKRLDEVIINGRIEPLEKILNLIDKQQKEIDNQNKVIDLILNDYMTINEIRTMMGLPHSITTADELKEVYFRKVEEDDKK